MTGVIMPSVIMLSGNHSGLLQYVMHFSDIKFCSTGPVVYGFPAGPNLFV
jgi:hypothetical protein